ncbi:MAG TPA: serine hydroxymethyltransferase, partial [Candidatus Nanopelagicales bacterium]|nr:serine hydroxymethyltransferase [Candidatus Nanopelagicales bacterium]
NKNAIPYDPQPPSIASGIRVGSPATTTQGMDEADMALVARLIGRAVRDADGTDAPEIAAEVHALVSSKPAYAS